MKATRNLIMRRRSSGFRTSEKRGARAKEEAPGHNLALRLSDKMDRALLFLHDLSVLFTNNVAERALRMMNLRMKISGCFRTLQGADDFAIMRSIIDTAHKYGMDVMEVFFRNAGAIPRGDRNRIA